MNAITPPKEMPPLHSAAARGTLPMEQTKLMMAMNGPDDGVLDTGPEPVPGDEDRLPDRRRHQHRQEPGHGVADDQLAPQHGEVGHGVRRAVGPAGDGAHPDPQRAIRSSVRASPSPATGSCWCSAASSAACRRSRACTTRRPRNHSAPKRGEETDHDEAPDELADGELPAHQHNEHDPELNDEVGRGEHEDHGGDVVGALDEERLGHGGRGVGARGRDHPVARRPEHGARSGGRRAARRMASRLTKACTAPARPKPSTRGQSVSQNMKKPSRSDRPMSTRTVAVASMAVRSGRAGRWPPRPR